VKREHIDRSVSELPMMVFEKARYFPHRLLHVLRLSAKNLGTGNFSPELKKYYVVTFLAFTGFLTFYVALPVYLKSYVGITTSEVFVVFLASSIVSALTYSLAGRWVARYGGKRMQVGAFVGRIVLFPSFFLVTALPLSGLTLIVVLCVLHALIGFCWANLSVAGNALVSNMSYADFRTESLGTYNAIQGLAAIFGSLIGGFIAEYLGYFATFIAASAFIVPGAVVLLFLNVEKAPSEAESPHAAHP
ncbi:MAG: MFS transporter, partial [Euryarchaeota archaeon]|nr:MFS transporter [Euryarchaeota archaeon]